MHWELVFVMIKRIMRWLCVCVTACDRVNSLCLIWVMPPRAEQKLLCLVEVKSAAKISTWTHFHGYRDMWCMAGGYRPRSTLIPVIVLFTCAYIYTFYSFWGNTFKALQISRTCCRGLKKSVNFFPNIHFMIILKIKYARYHWLFLWKWGGPVAGPVPEETLVKMRSCPVEATGWWSDVMEESAGMAEETLLICVIGFWWMVLFVLTAKELSPTLPQSEAGGRIIVNKTNQKLLLWPPFLKISEHEQQLHLKTMGKLWKYLKNPQWVMKVKNIFWIHPQIQIHTKRLSVFV